MSPNIAALVRVVARLGALNDDVVFLGGAVVELLVTEPGAPEPRVTADVDAVVEVTSRLGYYEFADALRRAGFTEDRTPDAPLCRWLVEGIRVDLMPPDEKILGFVNRWYPETLRTAETRTLPGGAVIKVASAPCFLATKLEAFDGRGGGDYRASHDIEDISRSFSTPVPITTAPTPPTPTDL